MPDLRIGERGESVIDFMTEHLGGFFDLLKDILNFGLRSVYDLLTVLTPVAMVVVLVVLAVLATRRVLLSISLGLGAAADPVHGPVARDDADHGVGPGGDGRRRC